MAERQVDTWSHDFWAFEKREFLRKLGIPEDAPMFNVSYSSIEQKVVVMASHKDYPEEKEEQIWRPQADPRAPSGSSSWWTSIPFLFRNRHL